jgi:hypothetical protein
MARKRKAKAAKAGGDKALHTHGKRLDALISQARKTEQQAAKMYARQRRVLRVKQAQAKKALARLRRRSAAATPPLKAGLQRAWSELNAAVREAAARFRTSR